MSSTEIICSVKNITMEFPGVKALNDVSIDFYKGEVHALLGENGAGKSTLMKILSGHYRPNAGEISIDGVPVELHNVADSISAGVSMVYQELNQVPDLTVAENILLSREPKRFGLVSKPKMNEMAKEALLSIGVTDIDPTRQMSELNVAQAQLVEIARVTSLGSKIIIMDEPTSALAESEVLKIFKVINLLREKGTLIIYISHKMDEIFQIADRVSVLRDGELIATKNIGELDNDSIIKMMVGRELSDIYPPKSDRKPANIIFEVENLCSAEGKFENISFSVRAGEILGIAGLMGAGRSETVETIFGLRKASSGTIRVNGQVKKISRVSDAIKCGIALITEDRKGSGLVLCSNVAENMTLASLKKFVRRGLVNSKSEKDAVSQYVDQLRIRVSGIKQIVGNLSGGNQQKVVLGKWLLTDADIIIFDDPTRGIDVGAKHEIYLLMSELAKNGKAIIMISSEMSEIIGMSDRVVVLCDGKLTGELQGDEINQYTIMQKAADL